jgi:predicted DNA-binding helix-hairpin-helix protein
VQLAPEKKSAVIESTMAQIRTKAEAASEERRTLKHAPQFAPAGQSTQMVVGATAATDHQIIHRAATLYGNYKLRRIYYTGFSPYPEADARLPLKATPLLREHRLYQADWLMRHYGFAPDEITTDADDSLSLEHDPKTAWAKAHPEFFPVDVNAAPRETLLRVPGIGYRNVERILRIRRYHRLSLDDLRKLNVRVKQVSAWVTTTDHLPSAHLFTTSPPATQLDLFAVQSAVTGVL